MKPPLLYLCHRIPYPPNKGDKIRSFNQLAYLAKEFDVYLGCFVDEPSDMAYAKKLSQYVKGMYVLPLNKRHATFRGVLNMGRSNPITLPYYFDPKMAQWVNNTLANFAIRNVLVYCSSMAQYVDSPQYEKLNRVIDFVDLDSDKWRQYAKNQNFPMSWVYNREFRTLLAYEQKLTEQFDASVFISSNEIELFCRLSNISSHSRIHAVSNGVDLQFFDPAISSPAIKHDDTPTVVFTGAMDYWANVDAVRWFVKHVWPYITKRMNNTRLLIVGSNPSEKIRELDAFPNIKVTGKVDDIRSYIQSGWVSIAPMRIARGIQNKVLEAMAMELPVVATSLAMEGLVSTEGCNVAVEDNAELFAQAVVERLEQHLHAPENRQWVVEHYRWDEQLDQLKQLIVST